MGLAGAGNVGHGAVRAVRAAAGPGYGWQAVYGIAAVAMLLPDGGDDRVRARSRRTSTSTPALREHIACLFEKDGWAFSLIYVVTFGGFIGLATFLPSYYYDQFGVSKVQAGQLTMLAAFMGAAVRVFGGWISDRWGGINTLTAVLAIVAVTLVLCGVAGNSLVADDAAVHAVLRRAGRRQRRAVPAGAAALAAGDRGGRLDDRRDRRPGRRLHAQRHGPVEAVHRHLLWGFVGFAVLRPGRCW